MVIHLIHTFITTFCNRTNTTSTSWHQPLLIDFSRTQHDWEGIRCHSAVCYAECDKISRWLISKSSHTIYYQVAYNQYQLFFWLLNHTCNFLQLILPLLLYNSGIQCPYHVRLECQVRWYVIQDPVFINQDAVLINQEVKRQLLINSISDGDWIMAANRFFVSNTEEFEGLAVLLQQCGLYDQEIGEKMTNMGEDSAFFTVARSGNAGTLRNEVTQEKMHELLTPTTPSVVVDILRILGRYLPNEIPLLPEIPIVYQLLGSNVPYLEWVESLEKQLTLG